MHTMHTLHKRALIMKKLGIKPPPKEKQSAIADFQPYYDQALALARRAREANTAGNHKLANELMAEHDSIYDWLESLLTKE